MRIRNPKRGWGKWVVLTGVLGVYAISFFLPVTDAGTPQVMYGYQAFFWGLASVLYLPMWLANPVLVVGCVRYGAGSWKAARNAGLLAVLLAGSEVWFWDDRPEVGYYLWVGSMLFLAAAGAVQAGRFPAPRSPRE